jgi:curved DNA-binding protein
MEFKNYYAILDIAKDANPEDIERAYRKLARRYHPDVNPDDETAKERFNEIDEARRVLTNPEASLTYRRLAERWDEHQRSEAKEPFDWSQWVAPPGSDQSVQGEEANFSDFFKTVFGHVKPGPVQEADSSTPHKGEDYHQTVEISLEEAFTGATRILRLGGRRIEVKIPKGARTGTQIRVRGEGAEGAAGGPKGDLYLQIVVTPHDLFEWVGDDLHLDLPVNLYSALLGGEAIVSTLKGKIKLKIPAETQSGRVFRLKGQGMPKLKNADERGDLYAKVIVILKSWPTCAGYNLVGAKKPDFPPALAGRPTLIRGQAGRLRTARVKGLPGKLSG